tara:strand:+ start:786 stop:1400 length:615 start_codon:yes stop_codon:yes gene_type:complete
MKSIVLFGKGPSVSKCSKEIIEKYDDIAIINYPFLNDFFVNLILNREIKYHFANCATYDERYTNQINDMLNIKNIINTHIHNNYIDYLKNISLFKGSIRKKYETYFKNYFDLDPNSGIMALQFIIDTDEYDNILLVGFDNYKIGEQIYYYPIDNINTKIQYLINQNTITKEGNFNIVNGHNPEKTEIYLSSLKNKYPNIKIERL